MWGGRPEEEEGATGAASGSQRKMTPRSASARNASSPRAKPAHLAELSCVAKAQRRRGMLLLGAVAPPARNKVNPQSCIPKRARKSADAAFL